MYGANPYPYLMMLYAFKSARAGGSTTRPVRLRLMLARSGETGARFDSLCMCLGQ